ncbi:UNKNOWN [Stylonychia lemnae]|uniref:Uncharacterized protein n=1 Tax=Stylonychia lemnae TaxID=5949 RepID=A0A078B2S2_STYLE|nr:UNKNOWN [Stylonychia lemnae]|eukprot:CDW88536.1 UNKNOWN [Stylonychia lemnae]
MVIKVYVEPVVEDIHHDDMEMVETENKPNLNIRVKNTDTLDEYRGQAYLNTAFNEKMNRWIKKGKYQCKMFNNNAELELRVEIFKFMLKKVPKTEVELLKQELCMMRKENQRIKGEQKLFRYYFLNMWKDRSRQFFYDKPEMRMELLESSQNLYDQSEATGVIMEEFGSKGYYLNFVSQKVHGLEQLQQSMCNFAGTPGGANQSTTLGGPSTTLGGGTATGPASYMNKGKDLISNLCELGEQSINGGRYVEVFILGGAYQYQKACLDIQKLFNSETGDVFSLVQINLPIEDAATYTVFIPKRLAN